VIRPGPAAVPLTERNESRRVELIIDCWLFIPQTPGAGGSQRAAEHAGSPFRLRSTSRKWKGRVMVYPAP